MRYLFPLNPWNQQRQFEKPVWVYPAHIAMYATYLRDQGHEVVWDADVIGINGKSETPGHGVDGDYNKCKIISNDYQIDVPFEKLPAPDREFTDAMNKRWQSYGNYKFHPATHMMVSNLCWYGKCTFCVDTKKLHDGEKRGVRSVDHVIEEIDTLINQGYKEVFDDSGTFPVGAWLNEFCKKMNEPHYNMTGMPLRKDMIKIGCNMKPIRLDYQMMADAGFRFILVGIESANQNTVDKIKKGQCSEDIVPIIKSMSDAGLEPHTTWMSSFPWETEQEEQNSIDMCNYLLKKGYAKTTQVSIYSPPRTQPDPNSIGHRRVPLYYDAYKSVEFWYHKLKDIKCIEDITYILRGGRLVFEEHWRKFCHRLHQKKQKDIK